MGAILPHARREPCDEACIAFFAASASRLGATCPAHGRSLHELEESRRQVPQLPTRDPITPRRGAGREGVVALLTRNYRLWATLPVDVDALLCLGVPGSGEPIAVVPRPPFPPGTCRSCGCTQDDACLLAGETCGWADDTGTLCTACDVVGSMRRGV